MTLQSPPPPSAPATATPSTRPAKPLPPEWAVERAVKFVGRATGALGRGLDRLATVPLLKPPLKMLNSIWVGISILVLLALYIAIGSGFSQIRASMEMTDLQFFDWYPMRILVAWLALTLTVVTLRRIPLTLFKLGSWTVHVGIITLIVGSVWYFSHKTEGSMRLYLNQPRTTYFDATQRALYAYPIAADGTPDQAHGTMTPLPGLPIFYEYLAENGKPLDRPVPASALADLGPAFKDVHATITGYYPAAILQPQLQPDHAADANPTAADAPPLNPAISLSMTLTGVSGGRWMIANSPAGRVVDDPGNPNVPFGIEYLYHPDADRLADISVPLTTPLGVTVRIPADKFSRTYSVQPGQKIAVEGTPYTLQIGGQQTLPLISKGYEGSSSNSLMVTVDRKDPDGKQTSFQRMVLFRYPERSPDFITEPDGKQKRIQDRVDNNIQITFQDAQRDQFWVVEHDDGSLEMIEREAGGKVKRTPMGEGEKGAVVTNVGGVPLQLAVVDRTAHLAQVEVPTIIPPEQRKRGQTAMDAMAFSAVELEVTRGDSFRAEKLFVPFVQFAQIGDRPIGEHPTVVTIPGVGKVGFLLSTVRRELPSAVTLTKFEAIHYPGATRSFADFVSYLNMKNRTTGQDNNVVARLNEPAANHGLYYFQAGWDGDADADAAKRFSILGVGNRPGIWVMIVGSALMILGIGYAFYVKPILLKMKKTQLAQWAAARKAAPTQ